MSRIKTVSFSEYTNYSKSKYKNVRACLNSENELFYRASLSNSFTGFKWIAFFTDENEAGKEVDLQLIKQGKEPVNILKRK